MYCLSLICLVTQQDRCARFSCAQCNVSFCVFLFLASINFFPPFHPPSCVLPRFTLSHGDTSWTTCPLFAHCGASRFLLLPPFPVTLCCFFNCPPLPPNTKNSPCVCMAPFRLEILECTVAPVAMEDSDHEVQSSSDEHDSCPTSPNHSRDHNADQVLDIFCDLP